MYELHSSGPRVYRFHKSHRLPTVLRDLWSLLRGQRPVLVRNMARQTGGHVSVAKWPTGLQADPALHADGR